MKVNFDKKQSLEQQKFKMSVCVCVVSCDSGLSIEVYNLVKTA